MVQRRVLKYEDWSAVEKDLRELLKGYRQHGNWNLAQIALHLNDWLRFPMDGYPVAPFPIRVIMSAVRATLGKSLLRKTLEQGFPAGKPTMPQTVHQASEADAAQAVDDLLATVYRFQHFTGPIQPSPLFGPMDKATARQLQLLHFAHHLSFLSPEAEQQ